MRRPTLLPTILEDEKLPQYSPQEFDDVYRPKVASPIRKSFDAAARRASEVLSAPIRRVSVAPALPRRTIPLLLLVIVCILVEIFLRFQLPVEIVLPEYGLIDPYSQPGHLIFEPDDPLAARWQPFDQSVVTPDWNTLLRLAGDLPLPDPHWNAAIPNPDSIVENAQFPLSEYSSQEKVDIQQEMLGKIAHLRNSTILMLGDSVDRNAVDQFGVLFQQPTEPRSFDGSEITENVANSPGLPHVFHFGGDIDLTIVNGFFYGVMDQTDAFASANDWMAPGAAEERIEQLFKPLTDRLEHSPTLIVLHSGMWDLAFFGQQDKSSSASTNTPLTDDRLQKWQERMTSTIRKVKATWPGVPIVLRKLHRVGPSQGAADWQIGQPHVVNYFTNIRFHQLRSMQQYVAQQEGIAIFDFGALFEGFQRYQDKVHPLLYPGGVIMANGIMHQAYLAKHDPFYNTFSPTGKTWTSRKTGAAYLRHSRIAAFLLDKTGGQARVA